MIKSLSSYWAGAHHRALGSTTDNAVRLAIALSAARSIIRVVDRSQPPMNVEWAAYDPTENKGQSYTDFQRGNIRLNPAPVLDSRIGHGDALDITSAFALHEASHSQESRDRYTFLVRTEPVPSVFGDPANVRGKEREVPAFEPMRIAAYLWNLVEDVRIEAATSGHWPGFEPYFERLVDYLWTGMAKHVADKGPIGEEPDIASRLRVVFAACRFGDQAQELVKPGIDIADEMAWWREWQADYLTDRVDTPTTIQRGLDRLRLDEETAQEMDKMAADERREREAGEKLRAQIDRLLRDGIAGAFGLCATEDGELVPLDAEMAEQVAQYVREGLAEVKTIITPPGGKAPQLFVRKPVEDYASKRAYVGRPNAESEALRAALVFRQSAPEYTEKLLRDGQVDDEEVWRWAAGDNRIFGQRVIESKPDVFMGLLVDLSGSMEGEKLNIAQRLAQLFAWAVHDQEGIATAVWGHQASSGTADVYRLWEQGDSLTRLGLIQTLDHGGNSDGTAIEYCASQIAAREQPEKVLLVLSDGLPSVPGGPAGQQHVRAVVRWAEARGVRVHQIAIDPSGLRPQDQSLMYGDAWTGFTSYAALPRQIASLLGKYL